MTERNLCMESGCKAYCCFGPEFPALKISESQILEWFHDARETRSIELSMIKNERGVFYKKTGDKFIIKIIGYCTNLDENFGCKIQGAKPEPCENFELGHKDCISVRLTHFLPPYQEWAIHQKP